MSPATPSDTDPSIEARRKRARRTALLVAGIAVAVYLGFILSEAVGR